MRLGLFATAIAVIAFGVSSSARANNLVLNGSLEDLNSNFVNTAANYESLFAGSTAIADWTVSAGTINEIVWAKSPTGDGRNAADGTFFVDLSGFGSDSSNGAIEQALQNLIVSQQYTFSMDVEVSGLLPLVTVGGVGVSLSAGAPFIVGSDVWVPESGTFTAGSANPLLKIMNQNAGQQIYFIDNISVTGSTSAVPEPSSIQLFGVALAGLCLFRLRKALSQNRCESDG